MTSVFYHLFRWLFNTVSHLLARREGRLLSERQGLLCRMPRVQLVGKADARVDEIAGADVRMPVHDRRKAGVSEIAVCPLDAVLVVRKLDHSVEHAVQRHRAVHRRPSVTFQ